MAARAIRPATIAANTGSAPAGILPAGIVPAGIGIDEFQDQPNVEREDRDCP